VNRPWLALTGLVAALAAVVGVGTVTGPATGSAGTGTSATASATASASAGAGAGASAGSGAAAGSGAGTGAAQVPVVGGSAVCPSVRNGAGLQTQVSAGAVSSPAGATADPAAADGSITAALLTGTGTPALLPVQRPGQVATGLVPDLEDDALVLSARGPLAGALVAGQTTRGARGADRGLAALRCTAPQTDTWFAGGSLGVGEESVLVLVNPDDSPALVDVRIWSAQGGADERPGRGLVVPARSRTALPLDELAPGQTRLAVHVGATRGRVAAALRHTRVDGRVPQGAEWVPPAPAPAPQVVVPGLPAGTGRRSVLVTNPGVDPVVVQLQVSTADGQFVPTGLDAVRVPAGETVSSDLTGPLARSAATVVVRSETGPVLAVGLAVEGRRGGPGEFSYAGAAVPLSGPALLPEASVAARREDSLLLSAPEQDAQVVVRPLRVLGSRTALGKARTVRVVGGRTTELALADLLAEDATGALAVEVRSAEGSGPVYAARFVREQTGDGPLITGTALQSAAQAVTRPEVVADPGAVITPDGQG